MNTDQSKMKAVLNDLQVLETTVPAHMVLLMLEACGKQGYEARLDVLGHLSRAVAAPMMGRDGLSISRLARRTDELARSLLNDLSPDDPREGLYVCATFILTLIEEFRWHDKTNQAVLVSMLLLEDVRDDSKDVDGQGSVWRLQEAKWQTLAKDILRRANLQGMYLNPIDKILSH